MQKVLLGIALLAVVLAMVACGGPSKPTTGIYGIAVTNPGGRIGGGPSPLPRGFGASYMVSDRLAHIVIRKQEGDHAGKVVATVVADTSGVFRVSLPPGTYVVRGEAGISEVARVSPGEFVHVVVETLERF